MAGIEFGIITRLVPTQAETIDEFAVDIEPDEGDGSVDVIVRSTGVLSPSGGTETDQYLRIEDGVVFDNSPPADARWVRISLNENEAERACCPGAANARLAPQRYGPPFFMGVAMPALIESLARPLDEPGRPVGGRRALTFSDSRQGTARLAAKLQQDAERNLTRAFLFHSVQQGRGLKEAERAKLERKLAVLLMQNDPIWDEEIRDIKKVLQGETEPLPWGHLKETFAQQRELRDFATEVWRERAGGGREMAQEPERLSEMFLYRELLRRPKVQNNAETMGLLRLAFPALEQRAALAVPAVLGESRLDGTDWTAMALAAIDFVFRD